MTHKSATDRTGPAVIALPSATEILITRTFNAPAARIFEAFTTPDLIRQWWADPDAEWLVCEVDLRPGGRWRWAFRLGDTEVGFHGEYRDIARPNRLVYSEMFEIPGAPPVPPGAYPVVTMTLAETSGVTTLTQRSQFHTRDVRDMVLASGMEAGMQRSYNRLEAVASARR